MSENRLLKLLITIQLRKKYFNSLFYLSLFLELFSCNSTIENHNKINIDNTKKWIHNEKHETNRIDSIKLKKNIKSFITNNLIDIQIVNPSILVDLKYASEDNFMKQKLYFQLDKLYLQNDVALRLSKVQTYLKSLNSELSLLVYDGVRPLSVQQKMWDALDSIPVAQRTKFVSNPANGSLHNYGAAVDLTICDINGNALDMGANYDDIREIAYPKYEKKYFLLGELNQIQINNRKLLRKVMASQNFVNIPTEWWHFNACSREVAKKKYRILK